MQKKQSKSRKIEKKSNSWGDNDPRVQSAIQSNEYNQENLKAFEASSEENLYDDKQLTTAIEDSKNKHKDWNANDAFYSGHLSSWEPDESIDYIEDFKKLGNIHQQKEASFSCIGYAVSDLVHWHLEQKGIHVSRLSARFNWIAAKEIDENNTRPTTFIEQAGSTLKAGLDVARNYGSVPDDFFPTDKEETFKGTAQHFYAHASKYRIANYFSLIVEKELVVGGRRINKTEHQKLQTLLWKKWINEKGPILVRVNVDRTFYHAKGRSPLVDYGQNEAYQKHAALLIGYNQQGFILRNSWGTDWGNKGSATLGYSYAQEALDEAYGITLPNDEVGRPLHAPVQEKTFYQRLLDFFKN